MACLGIIGGTGLESLAALTAWQTELASTRWGETSAGLYLSQIENTNVVFLSRHGNGHSIAPHKINYRANIAAMQEAGVDAIIGVNAVGGVNPQMQPGDLVIPDQIVDYTWGREQTFFDGADNPLKHIDFSYPYSEFLRKQILAQAASLTPAAHDRGVYGVTQGPRLETAAEVQKLARDGCDIVGMTGMPEAALARELDIPYACLALVVNPAAGLTKEAISMPEIEKVLADTVADVQQLLLALAAAFAD